MGAVLVVLSFSLKGEESTIISWGVARELTLQHQQSETPPVCPFMNSLLPAAGRMPSSRDVPLDRSQEPEPLIRCTPSSFPTIVGTTR